MDGMSISALGFAGGVYEKAQGMSTKGYRQAVNVCCGMRMNSHGKEALRQRLFPPGFTMHAQCRFRSDRPPAEWREGDLYSSWGSSCLIGQTIGK